MADAFTGEIRIFPFNFAPQGWAFCDGQLLPLSQNTALFALIGTYFGGNGKSNFALPDLKDSVAVHWGQGQGLSEYFQPGIMGGSSTVTLLQSEVPVHTHTVSASGFAGDNIVPGPNVSLAGSTGGNAYRAPAAPLQTAAPQALQPAGGDQPHNNDMPYLTLSFCIALQGVFPPRG